MLAWLKRFYLEARGKLTTYVGILIAGSAELYAEWPDLIGKLPHWGWLAWLEAHAYVLLGVLVVWARVRRALKA